MDDVFANLLQEPIPESPSVKRCNAFKQKRNAEHAHFLALAEDPRLPIPLEVNRYG